MYLKTALVSKCLFLKTNYSYSSGHKEKNEKKKNSNGRNVRKIMKSFNKSSNPSFFINSIKNVMSLCDSQQTVLS